MTAPCIPTLHANAGVITDKSDIVAYVIRHVLAQPKNASIHYENFKVSFRALEAAYGSNTTELRVMLERKLDEVLKRYIPDGSVRISVTSTETDTEGWYTLDIKASSYDSANTGTLLLTDAKVTIKDGKIFNITFQGAKI